MDERKFWARIAELNLLGTPDALAERQQLLEAYDSNPDEVTEDPAFLHAAPLTDEEMLAIVGELDDDIREAANQLERAMHTPAGFEISHNLITIDDDLNETLLDPEKRAQSRPLASLGALIRTAGAPYAVFKVRIYLPNGFEPVIDEALCERYGIADIAEAGSTKMELLKQWQVDQAFARLERYCTTYQVPNEAGIPEACPLIPVDTSVMLATRTPGIGFIDVTLRPVSQLHRGFGTQGLGSLVYHKILETPANVRDGYPHFEQVETLAVTTDEMNGVHELLDMGTFVGDGYGFSFPTYWSEDDCRTAAQHFLQRDVSDEEVEHWLMLRERRVAREFQFRWGEVVPAAPDGIPHERALAKGMLLPLDRDTVKRKLLRYYAIRDLTSGEDRQAFEAKFNQAAGLLEQILNTPRHVVMLIKGDQIKVGADTACLDENGKPAMRKGLMIGTYLTGVDPKMKTGKFGLKPARFRMRGSSQQLMALEAEAYPDIVHYLQRIMNRLLEQTYTTVGLCQIVDEAAASAREEMEQRMLNMDETGITPDRQTITRRNDDLVGEAFASTLVRPRNVTKQVKMFKGEAAFGPNNVHMLEALVPYVSTAVGHRFREIEKTFGAKFDGSLNFTCDDDLETFVRLNQQDRLHACSFERVPDWDKEPLFTVAERGIAANGIEDLLQFPPTSEWELPEDETTWTWDTLVEGLRFEAAIPSDYERALAHKARRRCDVYQSAKTSPIEVPILSDSATFIPKSVANILSADDDGDIVAGKTGILPVNTNRVYSEGTTRRRFTRVERLATVSEVTRYPQVAEPGFFAGPVGMPTPWLGRTRLEEEDNAAYLAIAAPRIDGLAILDKETVHIAVSPRLPNIRARYGGTSGVKDGITKERISGEITLQNALWYVKRKKNLNKTGVLTRNLEIFYALRELAIKQHADIRKENGGLRIDAMDAALYIIERRILLTQDDIEMELMRLKRNIGERDPQKLYLPKDVNCFSWDTNKEVRLAVLPSKTSYHSVLRSIDGVLKRYRRKGTLCVEDLVDPRNVAIPGQGKQVRALNVINRGTVSRKTGEIIGGQGVELVNSLNSIRTSLTPFVNDLEEVIRTADADPETATNMTEVDEIREAIKGWGRAWAEFLEDQQNDLAFAADPDTYEAIERQSGTFSRVMRLKMRTLGRRVTRGSLAQAVYDDWSGRELIDRRNAGTETYEYSTQNVIATLALASTRLYELFDAGNTEVEFEQIGGTVDIYRSGEDLPGAKNAYVPGKVHYSTERDVFVLQLPDQTLIPLKVGKGASDARPTGEQPMRLFKTTARMGLVIY